MTDVMQVRRGWRQALAIAAAAVAVAGLVACGASNDESATTGATSTAAESPGDSSTGDEHATSDERDGDDRGDGGGAAAGEGGDRGGAATDGGADDGDANVGDSEDEQVADTVRGMYRALASSDASGVCAVMTEKAREEIARQPPGGGQPAPGEGSCVDSLSRFLGAAASSGVLEQSLKATVTGVEVTGRAAVATVALGGRSGKVRLVREDGEWRFGAPPTAAGTQ